MTPKCKLKQTIVSGVIALVVLLELQGTCGFEARKLNPWSASYLNNESFESYMTKWNTSIDPTSLIDEEYIKNMTVGDQDDNYVQEPDEIEDPELYNSDINSFYGQSISDTVFHNSANNFTLIFTDFSKCLYDYNFLTCLKMLLLNRVNNMLELMERRNLTQTDFFLLNGYVAFSMKNESGQSVDSVMERRTDAEVDEDDDDERYLSLDQELAEKVLQLFKHRSLKISLLPGFGIEVAPAPRKSGDEFICFTTKTFKEPSFNSSDEFSEMRMADDRTDDKNKDKNKSKKKKEGGFNMMPMMIVPQMVMLGFLPFALANLKMMVMNAFMVNSMALNGALMMTIRNLVFGAKGGPKVKYVNYGYKKKKVSKRPAVVIHAPAAFVKQEPVKKAPSLDSFAYPPKSGYLPDGPYPSSQGSLESYHDYESGNLYPPTGNEHYSSDDGYGNDYSDTNQVPLKLPLPNIVHTLQIRRKSDKGERRRTNRIRVKAEDKMPPVIESIVAQLGQVKNVPSKTIPRPDRKTTAFVRPTISTEFEPKIPVTPGIRYTQNYDTIYKGSSGPLFGDSTSGERFNRFQHSTLGQNYQPSTIGHYEPPIQSTIGHYSEPIQPTRETWSVQHFPPMDPTIQTKYNTPFRTTESEYPDYNFDILKVPTRHHFPPNNPHIIHYNSLGENQGEIDRNFDVNQRKQGFTAFTDPRLSFQVPEEPTTIVRTDVQNQKDYKNVFSSKYNKDLTDFERRMTLNKSNSKHENHNYSQL